jgi:hypothetical protein
VHSQQLKRSGDDFESENDRSSHICTHSTNQCLESLRTIFQRRNDIAHHGSNFEELFIHVDIIFTIIYIPRQEIINQMYQVGLDTYTKFSSLSPLILPSVSFSMPVCITAARSTKGSMLSGSHRAAWMHFSTAPSPFLYDGSVNQ